MIPTTVKTDQVSQQLQTKNVTAIKPVSSVTPVTVVADPGDSQNEFILGQKYKALVDSRLSSGTYSVLISNKLFQMRLPENILPGDKLELLFLTDNPKLKFSLESTNTTLSSKNNATISQVGRLLDLLIQDAEKTNIKSTPSLAPILNDSSINKQELPVLLQKAILQSGLFYESHLAKWINGKSTLEKIQQEPQNQLKISTNNPSTSTISSQTTLPINSQNLSLVQQQLITLETGHIVWRGEILNGQSMEWVIHEDGPSSGGGQITTTRWKTKLTLTFPKLGKITTTIALNAQDIQIELSADKTETMQLLQHNQPVFKKNMYKTGLTVNSFELNLND